MNIGLLATALFFSGACFAQIAIQENLRPEDQKYYKNESFDGMNKLERIDSLVKEVNNLHGKIASLQAEMNQLRAEVQELKNKQETK